MDRKTLHGIIATKREERGEKQNQKEEQKRRQKKEQTNGTQRQEKGHTGETSEKETQPSGKHGGSHGQEECTEAKRPQEEKVQTGRPNSTLVSGIIVMLRQLALVLPQTGLNGSRFSRYDAQR